MSHKEIADNEKVGEIYSVSETSDSQKKLKSWLRINHTGTIKTSYASFTSKLGHKPMEMMKSWGHDSSDCNNFLTTYMSELANSQIMYEWQFQAGILMSCSSNRRCLRKILPVNKPPSKRYKERWFPCPSADAEYLLPQQCALKWSSRSTVWEESVKRIRRKAKVSHGNHSTLDIVVTSHINILTHNLNVLFTSLKQSNKAQELLRM